jgi:hypothetical protein
MELSSIAVRHLVGLVAAVVLAVAVIGYLVLRAVVVDLTRLVLAEVRRDAGDQAASTTSTPAS